jgi:hypothetical protein
MKEVYVPYSVWKQIASSETNLTIYVADVDGDPSHRQAIIGDEEVVYATNVEPTDAVDFDTSFPTTTTVADREEGFAQALFLRTRLNTRYPKLEVWSDVSMPQSLGSSYETLWEKSATRGQFFSCVFSLSSDEIYMKVTSDDVVLVDVYLDDLHDDYGLKAGSDRGRLDFPLYELSSRKWLYRPEIPVRFYSSFKVEFRRNGNSNRRVNRGLSSWGVL